MGGSFAFSNKMRLILLLVAAVGSLSFWLALGNRVKADSLSAGQKLVTVYEDGTERSILTNAPTLRGAFDEVGITIDPNDNVEPALDSELVATNYEVNIYRAHPVTIVEGETRVRLMSPYRTAKQIAAQANIALYAEDIAEMTANLDIVGQGMGLQLTITRATEFTLELYGKKTIARTQEKTVDAMLKSKGVTLSKDDTVSVSTDTSMTSGMIVSIWRNGAQTVTEESPVPFDIKKTLDVDHPIGYRQVKTNGTPGVRLVTYEVVMQDGKEISRKQIQNIIGTQPVSQVEILGNKPVNPLTKSKGAGYFTDSAGVSHRETYYDLPMNVVIGACGGGNYTVRADGAKIDRDGYILIAAHYGRYPRCSIVETSMGLGRVYDTGGFVAHHPDGFDLATDWTKNDGR